MKLNKKGAIISVGIGILIFGSAYYFMVLKPKKDAQGGTGTNGNTGGDAGNSSGSSGSSSGNGGFVGPIAPAWWTNIGTSTTPVKDPVTGFYIGQKLKASNVTPMFRHPIISPSDIAKTVSIGDEIGVYAGYNGNFIVVTARVGLGDFFGASTYYIQKSLNPIGI